MQIDNYEAAQTLTEKLKANLPIKVFPTKHLIQSLRQQGKAMKPNQAYEITSAFYSGDMGGITCTLKDSLEDQNALVVSITHLKIDPDHPLAPEIEAYQRQRTRMLAIQNSGGFAAELLAEQSPKAKKKNTKGFGQ